MAAEIILFVYPSLRLLCAALRVAAGALHEYNGSQSAVLFYCCSNNNKTFNMKL